MKTLQKLSCMEDALLFFPQLPVDKNLSFYKKNLFNVREVNNILVLRNQFFYITDLTVFNNIYVNDNVSNVLGYQPEDFGNLDFVYQNIHPDDVDFVYAITKKAIVNSRKFKAILLRNPFAGVFSIDYRIRHKNGAYIRVNRQTCCYKTDQLGNIVYAISLFTDISHIKQNNLITFALEGEDSLHFDFEDIARQYQPKVLSPREEEIIRYLSQGMSATQIGEKLFISTHTVIAHRRNILHKTKAKNTAELVKYAIEMGLI